MRPSLSVPRAVPNSGGLLSPTSLGGGSGKDPNSCRARYPPGSVIMWILNIGLIVSAVFALMNWTTITWMTGSTGWASVLEVRQTQKGKGIDMEDTGRGTHMGDRNVERRKERKREKWRT